MLKLTYLALMVALGSTAAPAQETAATESSYTACGGYDMAELPSGESIMDKYIEVTGGKEAYKAIKNSVSKATTELPGMGMTASVTLYKAQPNLLLSVMEIPGIGNMLSGCDGNIVWSFNSMQGPSIMDGKAAQDGLDDAGAREEEWRNRYTSIQTLGIEVVEGEECYKLQLITKSGKQETHYYSKASGLVIRSVLTRDTPMGEVTVDVLLKDYRKAGNILVPFKQIQSMAGMSQIIIFTEIKHNVDIPASTFVPPAEVMELIKGTGDDCRGDDDGSENEE